MTEEKQIEELKKCLDDQCIDLELWNEPDRRFLAELVVREFGYRKQSEWISVKEALPDNQRMVLIACEGTTIGGAAPIAIGSFDGGFWFIADANGTAYLTKYMHVVVTHWMDLPEPPKMKGGE
jgi:hypothetical protein